MTTTTESPRFEGGGFLLDSNVLLDIATADPSWGEWSRGIVATCIRSGVVYIDPIVYAEISVGFASIGELDRWLDDGVITRAPLPYPAGFLAAKAHQAYRRRGGTRASTLPDFFVGAHALVEGLTLVTRDARRYRSAYPGLRIIAPED